MCTVQVCCHCISLKHLYFVLRFALVLLGSSENLSEQSAVNFLGCLLQAWEYGVWLGAKCPGWLGAVSHGCTAVGL